MGNLSVEIVFSHDTCYAAEQGNSNCQVFFVRRSQQAKLGVCCSGPEGRILLTSWHLMTVLRKGKISPVHAVASNCTQ